jgi:hypothetical protein
MHFATVAVTPHRPLLSGAAAPAAAGVIEIELASGARVRISGSVAGATVAATIAALLRGDRR